MRALDPAISGYVDRAGARVYYEAFGSGGPVILLMPTWEIVHSRIWKFQIPYLARHGQVVTFDPRGNGRSDRPLDVAAYDRREFARDALAVLDAVGAATAAVVAWCGGGEELLLVAEQPERITSLVVLVAPNFLVSPEPADEEGPYSFVDELPTEEGWAKWNRHYWLRDWPGFLDFFFSRTFTEPHSTKQIEDAIGWGLETDPVTILRGMDAAWSNDEDSARELCAQVRCPVVIIQGTQDAIVGAARGPAVAKLLPSADLVTMDGSGHAPHLRDPVRTNLIIRDFACPPQPRPLWRRGRSRRKRALYLSSPIGLGHAQRDIAIAEQLRVLHPGLEIDWLAQHPVTAALAERGERIHPASAFLASEAGHIESESAGHDLHCFQAWRRMDEILVANFMVFQDLAADEWGTSSTTYGSATRPGSSITTCTRTPSSSQLHTYGSPTSSLAAGRRRRRARGGADGRLQRRDDRARRALPAAPGPGDLRRRARRHRAGQLRARTAGDPRVDRAEL